MKYQAVIFDMDGTLLNTAVDIHNCVNIYLKKFGYPERSVKDVEMAMGGGAKKLIAKMLPSGYTQAEYDAFFAEYLPYYETHGKDMTAPYPGILDLLSKLKGNGVKLAVVSSKPHKGVISLCDYYFKDIFDVAIGDSFGMKLKPAPDCVYEALKELKIDKTKAIYIGDSEYDILVAQNAKMDGVAVSWGYRDLEELEKLNPLFIANSVDELEKILFSEK